MTPKYILLTGPFFPCQPSQTIYIIDTRVLVTHDNELLLFLKYEQTVISYVEFEKCKHLCRKNPVE